MLPRTLLILTLVLGVILMPLSSFAAAPATVPAISTVRGKVVFVKVPPGYKSVTVQQRTGIKKKPWKILATKQTELTGGIVGILLKTAVAKRALFVSGERAIPETNRDGAGITAFLADPALQSSSGVTGAGGAMAGTVTMSAARSDALSIGNSVAAAPSRDVVESDIWRVAGDRLYFFNQLRGLQVFDISNPDDPTMLGQLREPNRGEQMYLLDPDHVALLTRPAYYFSLSIRPLTLAGATGTYDPGSGAVVIADVKSGKPVEIARVPYAGYLVETRLVGTALYVVSQVYDGSTDGLLVTSFDLSDPTNPRQTDTLVLGSYGGVVSATDRFLFVVRYSTDWRHSIIDVIDISAPNGTLVKRGKLTTTGQVQDKFKLHFEGDVLTTVSAVQRNWSGDWNAPANQTRTMVETFSLTRPATPVKLGSLELGVGETVRAVRFSEGRVYVVTFFTIDPLWVVSLADPKHPTLLGELEIPGFSTYIEPLGDRLVAVGRLDSQTAVSLFDVSNPAAPTLLSQLPLGDGYSYSEANWDEKAFSVIPEHNLVLVPYSGYDSATGWASRIQLIDLKRDGLTKRGIVDQGFSARRTEVVDDRILAISSSDLVTVDFSDRDHPSVTSDVEIAWRVDRVFLAGNYLVEIGGTADWSRPAAPKITVATAADPDGAVEIFDLENVPVTGATVRDGRLYIAQQNASRWGPIYSFDLSANPTTPAPTNPLILSVFDLSQLPKITRIGRTEANVDPGYGYGAGQLEPAWPNAGTLVWVRAQWSSWWWFDPMPIMAVASPGIALVTADTAARFTSQAMTVAQSGSLSLSNANLATSGATAALTVNASPTTFAASSMVQADVIMSSSMRLIAPWYRTSTGHEMVVFDVKDATAPKFTTKVDVRIGQTGDWSAPVAIGGKLHLSYMAYNDPVEIKEGALSHRFRHFMKSVDFADSAKPVVSDEVNIPGRLLAVTRGGATLLTIGCGFDPVGNPAAKRVFHTSSFDGKVATLVDQLETPSAYDPYALDGTTLLVGSWSFGAGQTGQLQAWQIGGDDKFALAGQITAPPFSSVSTLHGLLVGFGSGLPRLFDVSDPASLRDLSAADTSELTSGDLSSADGGPGLGIWQPQGNSGVGTVRLPQ